jgi:hypothetical protein
MTMWYSRKFNGVLTYLGRDGTARIRNIRAGGHQYDFRKDMKTRDGRKDCTDSLVFCAPRAVE